MGRLRFTDVMIYRIEYDGADCMNTEQKVLKFIQKHSLLEMGGRVVVGVSGGPDSLCLLHLFNSLSSQLNISLAVAHLHHGMRREGDAEAEMVGALAADWSLPFYTEKVNVPEYAAEHRLSGEEAGRILRYRFLLKTALRCEADRVAVGHHQDDQAETVLFNLLRGTGPDGLSGIIPCRPLGSSVRLIRPLLGLPRREIEQYCRDKSLSPALDATNLQTGYTRNRIRLELLPYLEERYNPRVKEALARLAVLAADDRSYLQAQAGRAWKAVSRRQGNRLIISRPRLAGLPRALRGRVLRMALEEFQNRKQVQWSHVQSIEGLAEKEGRVRELAFAGGVKVYCGSKHLVISPRPLAAKALPAELPLCIPGRTLLPGGGSIEATICRRPEMPWPPLPRLACLDYYRLPPALIIRARWPGARFYPQGAPGPKKLKDFLIDQKVPKPLRDYIPLVATAGGEVVWVAGYRIAHPYRITDSTNNVLVLKWNKP